MTDREKLVVLLESHCAVIGEAKCKAAKEEICSPRDCAECLADHLLANGVTVQRWIPVSEKLPDIKKDGELIQITQAVQATDGKESFFGHFKVCKANGAWMFVCATEDVDLCVTDTVTHWQSLPALPKEES